MVTGSPLERLLVSFGRELRSRAENGDETRNFLAPSTLAKTLTRAKTIDLFTD